MNKLLAALCVSVVVFSVPSTQAAEVALAPFYQKVTQMKPAGPLGKVIAKEKVDTKIPGAEAWRIAYISSDIFDKLTISTGLVIAPKGKPPKGGRPILAWSHGTTGTAQNCGPSQVLDPAQDLNLYFLIGGTSWTDFGLPAATDFIKLGYVLVATDYQGLGGGGKHQYAIAGTQGRDLINSARAVGAMGLSGGSKKVAFYGWSQGGGSVLAASSSTAYIKQKNTAFDDIDVVGAVSMAPNAVSGVVPKESLTDPTAAAKTWQSMQAMFADNIFNFSHLAMNAWAMDGVFPGVDLNNTFTAEGAKTINAIQATKCMHAGSDTYVFNVGAAYKGMFNPQPVNVQGLLKALVASSTPDDKPVAPMQVFWGDKDTVMPPIQSEIYQKQKCAIGGNVQRVFLPGASHFTTPGLAQPIFTQWIKDRFDGKPIGDGCKM